MKLKEFIWEELQKRSAVLVVASLRKDLFSRIQSSLDHPKDGEPFDSDREKRRKLLQQALEQLQHSSAAEAVELNFGGFAPAIETVIKEVVKDVIAGSIK
ncbi:hypothetical protein ES703_57167 [subsurface metagenome]